MSAAPNPIVRENRRAGTRSWLLSRPRIDPTARFRCPWIEGYASHASVRAGERISFYVSTNPSSRFTIDLYRSGWYGGAGGRHALRLGPFDGAVQPDPPVGPDRLRECRWDACATITVPDDWVSGVYLGKLTAEHDGIDSYLVFIVRDERPAEFLFQCSDLTWQAYNRWPDRYSLYDDGEKFWSLAPEQRVSFERPYGKYCQIVDAPLSTGSGEWLLWEFPFAYWLESRGYDVSYISGIDTHAEPHGLRRAKGFLSVGHDEFYTPQMYDNLRDAIAEGLSIGFFSGNTCGTRIGLEPGTDGVPHRVFRRSGRFAGPDNWKFLEAFPELSRVPTTEPDEARLIGARTTMPATGSADWICAAPDHWIFAGTGMRHASAIPGLVGWEYNGEPANLPGLEIVASGRTESHHGEGAYAATVYPGPLGNFVFNAATCWWADGLAEPPGYLRPVARLLPPGADARVQKITTNILERMRSRAG